MHAAATPTANYQLRLPFALLAASPALAAFHVTRARLLHPSHTTSSPCHCSRCGTLFLDGSGSIRTIRRPRKAAVKNADAAGESSTSPSIRILRKSCSVCGHREDIPVNSGNADTFPMPRKRRRQPKDAAAAPEAMPDPDAHSVSRQTDTAKPPLPANRPQSAHLRTPSSLSPHISAPALPLTTSSGKQKARQKKKTGLQDMLARNRERQEQEKSRDEQGLASFLEAL